jgi:hypothetical protein
MRQKEHFEEQKILSNDKRRKKRSCQNCWSEKDMGRRKPKRLKTGDKPDGEVVKVKVRVKVKVESDNDKEEESSDNDDNEEEEEEQVARPVAQVKRTAYVAPRPYVPPRPDYILMD